MSETTLASASVKEVVAAVQQQLQLFVVQAAIKRKTSEAIAQAGQASNDGASQALEEACQASNSGSRLVTCLQCGVAKGPAVKWARAGGRECADCRSWCAYNLQGIGPQFKSEKQRHVADMQNPKKRKRWVEGERAEYFAGQQSGRASKRSRVDTYDTAGCRSEMCVGIWWPVAEYGRIHGGALF